MKNFTKILAISLFLGYQLSESDVQAIQIDQYAIAQANLFTDVDQ